MFCSAWREFACMYKSSCATVITGSLSTIARNCGWHSFCYLLVLAQYGTKVCTGESTVYIVWLLSPFTCWTLVCVVSCVMDHCKVCSCLSLLYTFLCMAFGSMWYPMSLNPVCTCVLYQSTDHVSSCHLHLMYHFIPTIVYFLCLPAHVVICCEPVPIVQCREEAMPFMRVLLVAILPLLNTLAPRWRATSLTLMMLETQLCTWQPILVVCPWWSTSWDPVDLMWKRRTRLAHILGI